MTIAERIERLTARHEALAQTVELSAHQVEATSKTANLASQAVFELAAFIRNHEVRLDRLENPS